VISGEEATRHQSEWILVALAGVGTAIIVTDARACVVSMNPVAESLTGWPQNDAFGQPLTTVFRIENEQTRRAVTDPVAEVLVTGLIAGVANHTILIGRDGTEWILDESAAPIRDGSGTLVGAVLVFRDVGERRRIERAAEDARFYAEGIVEAVREPLIVLDAGLNVRTANRAFYRMFGGSPAQIEGKPFLDLDNQRWRIAGLRKRLTEALERSYPLSDFEFDRELPGVGRRVLLLNARPITPARLILLAIEDITDRRRMADAIKVSEARYRRLFETAQDGILIVDANTRLVFDANPFLTDLLGYGRDELVGKELWQIGLFKDIEANKAAFRELQARGYIRYEDLPLSTKDGRQIEVEFVSNVYAVGDARVIQCNIRDVTDRKRAENNLRSAHNLLETRVIERTADLARVNVALESQINRSERAETSRRDLQGRLATVQEDERRRIARELHDQMGQYLTALGLGLKTMEDAAVWFPDTVGQLQQLRRLTDQIGREVHDLALEIRPTALDDFGLPTALATYAEEWSERTGVAVDFHATGLDDGRLPATIETTLYRVVQEALTNVLRHAQAKRVSLVLQRTPLGVIAVIEDDGKGFESEQGIVVGGRLGLLGMRERLELVGGALTLESALGTGTTVIGRIPLGVNTEGVQ
jgi:PAS domain S-box-containing protein